MYHLSNLDIIILVIVVISALIALMRGLVKEVLSIVGWFLATAAIIYLLPVCLPFAKHYISSGLLAGIVTALVIFIVFFVIWIYTTSSIIGKIRTSKLNGLDRMLGLFFGIMRAFLLVILFNIMVGWIVPVDKQSEFLTESKYFKLAGSFAKPLEEMIPEETLQIIKDSTKMLNLDEKENKKDEKEKDEAQRLFEKLAQPKIKKASEDKKEQLKEETKGYPNSEREDLTRLIDSVE